MDDYVERSAVIDRIKKMANMIGFENPAVVIDCVIRCIENTPSADAVPTVHGNWITEHFQTLIPVEYDEGGKPILHDCVQYRCNKCARTKSEKEPFCNCGAKMDL